MVFGYNTSVAPREDDIVSANNTTGDITLSSVSKTIASSGALARDNKVKRFLV